MFLKGTTPPIQESGIANLFHWKFFFYGGIGVFLPIFFKCLYQIREHDAATPAAPPPLSFEKNAFVDPSDPTTLYVSMPFS